MVALSIATATVCDARQDSSYVHVRLFATSMISIETCIGRAYEVNLSERTSSIELEYRAILFKNIINYRIKEKKQSWRD